MSARKPKVGEVWSTDGRAFRVVLDVPDSFGKIVVADQDGNYYTLFADQLRPPKLTLDDLPPIPEYWVNIYPAGAGAAFSSVAVTDSYAEPSRIARVRLVPDPDSIVECDGRTVL